MHTPQAEIKTNELREISDIIPRERIVIARSDALRMKDKLSGMRRSALNMAESHRRGEAASKEFAEYAEGLIEILDLLIEN